MPRNRQYTHHWRYNSVVQKLPACACPEGFVATYGTTVNNAGMSEGRRATLTYFDGQTIGRYWDGCGDSSGGCEEVSANPVTIHCFGE